MVESAWASAKDGVAISAALGVVLVMFPWMAFPLSVLGVFGAAKATMDLVDTFWDALTEEQQSGVRSLAYEAGVNFNQIFQRRPA